MVVDAEVIIFLSLSGNRNHTPAVLQVVLWCTDSLKPKSSLEEHSFLITDVRFSPSMSRLATSSFDKTVRVWDADNVYSLALFSRLQCNSFRVICTRNCSNLRVWRLTNLTLCRLTIRSVLSRVIQHLLCHLIFIQIKRILFAPVIVMGKSAVGA